MSKFDAYMRTGTQYQSQADHAKDREFVKELESLINRYSKENASGTPDFLLAEFLNEQLRIWNLFTQRRANWRGESVELPALQQLQEKKTKVPAAVYTDNKRVVVGEAEVTITEENILWGLIEEVSLVIEDGRTTRDFFRQVDVDKRESTQDEAAESGVDAPPSGETDESA